MNRRIETKLTNKSINPILELTGVGIEFPTPKGPFKALTDVNLKIATVHLRRGSFHGKWMKTWFGTKPCTKTDQKEGGCVGDLRLAPSFFPNQRSDASGPSKNSDPES